MYTTDHIDPYVTHIDQKGREQETRQEHGGVGEGGGEQNCLIVSWMLNVPATCECISGTDLLRQFDVLPH